MVKIRDSRLNFSTFPDFVQRLAGDWVVGLTQKLNLNQFNMSLVQVKFFFAKLHREIFHLGLWQNFNSKIFKNHGFR